MKKIIITIVVAALLLFCTSTVLHNTAEKNAQKEHLWLMQTLLPGSETFVVEPYSGEDANIISVHKAENGFVVETLVYGYADNIRMLTAVNNDGKVTGLVVLEDLEPDIVEDEMLDDIA